MLAVSILALASAAAGAPLLGALEAPGLLAPAPVSSSVTAPIHRITPQQWADFNSTVGGRLHEGFPLARPCFPRAAPDMAGSQDTAECQNVQNSYKDDIFIANNFGGYQNSNWGTCQTSGDQCLLDYNLPQNPLAYTLKTCEQGSVSTYYVDVAEYQDVQEIFAFAKTYGVPLAIKNSGHDYKGRSSAPDSLGVWTHHLLNQASGGITRDTQFVPANCSSSKVYDGVTYGAGQGFLGLYQFAEANEITIVGGSSQTVGAGGGWIAGGGHSAVSNTLGLGVDRALQFKVVTPDGEYRTVSSCQNTDLFFALRGGGGSTFGVVVETVTTAAPKLTLQVAYFKYASVNPDVSRDFLTVLTANAQKWADEGWGGYIQPGAISSQTGGLVLFTPLLNNSAATLSMQPVADFCKSAGNVALTSEVVESPSFFQAFNTYLLPNDELVNLGLAIASRLIPKSNFEPANQAELVDAIVNGMEVAGNNIVGMNPSSSSMVYGGAPTQILVTTPINYPNPPSSAVTPAWRDSLWHILYAPTFNYDASTTAIADAFTAATTAAQFLRDITPGSGAYQNEADVHEPDHEASFWGIENYNRLVTLKAQYDPHNLLACWQCIGWSETQAKTNPRYSCYP